MVYGCHFCGFSAVFVVDLIIIGRKPYIPIDQKCVQHIVFSLLAIIFWGLSGACWIATCHRIYSGWLTEYPLSVDNLSFCDYYGELFSA